jgi:hypothetical protein
MPTRTRVREPASPTVASYTVGQRGGSGESRFDKVSGCGGYSFHFTRTPSAACSRLTPHTVAAAGASQKNENQTQEPVQRRVVKLFVFLGPFELGG